MTDTTRPTNLLEQHFPGVTAGDIWGGMAASAVVLPQAMAFGVALYSPAGFNASQGAIAGLLGAAIMCTVSGFFGGTRGLISAPTGPILVLLGGALTSLSQSGTGNGELLVNLAILMICTGVFQILIGLTGGGKLIKYIPYPVISGFLTGSAILMILSQFTPLSGAGVGESWQSWRWLPLATAVVTMIATLAGPRLFSRLPGTIAGLIFGSLVFHVIAMMNPADLPAEWMIGELPKLDTVGLDISGDTLHNLHWKIIVPAALALSILTSLDTLLTSVIADVTTGHRHNANLEMVGQGAGQILSSLSGGMAAAGTTGATIVAVKTGGRRWPGVFAGITFFVLILLGRDAGSLLPISVLAGIILAVSLHMFDLDILAWLKRPRTRQDAAVALLVTVVTVAYDLMVAVGLGVVIAIVLFIRTQIRASIVHRRSTGQQIRSVRTRSRDERELLNVHGDRIVMYELRGNLFFATADALLENLAADLEKPNYLILHMRRVQQVDLTAIKYLQQIASRLQKNGGVLIFCNIHKGMGIGKRMQKAFKKRTIGETHLHVLTFNGKDEALEFAEDALLGEFNVQSTKFHDTIPVRDNDLCRDLGEETITDLESVLQSVMLETGETLFAAGDPGDALYLVISGTIDIRLPTTRHHYKRLASCNPGAFFGELALLKPGPRVAGAVAMHKTELRVLSRGGFEKLTEHHPDTAIQVLHTLARIEVEHLRWSSAEIRHLSEW
jgi:SulP family sulfate permease